jgi:hypothetical protein
MAKQIRIKRSQQTTGRKDVPEPDTDTPGCRRYPAVRLPY